MARMSVSSEFGYKMIDLEYDSSRSKPFKLSWWDSESSERVELETESVNDLTRLAHVLRKLTEFAEFDGV